MLELNWFYRQKPEVSKKEEETRSLSSLDFQSKMPPLPSLIPRHHSRSLHANPSNRRDSNTLSKSNNQNQLKSHQRKLLKLQIRALRSWSQSETLKKFRLAKSSLLHRRQTIWQNSNSRNQLHCQWTMLSDGKCFSSTKRDSTKTWLTFWDRWVRCNLKFTINLTLKIEEYLRKWSTTTKLQTNKNPMQ